MLDAIRETLPVRKLRYSIRHGALVTEMEDGTLTPFTALRDGYRGMIAMIGDLAYKCAVLNPHLGQDALKKTSGVVLIDELDLHLHPSWQRRVIGDLRRIFPNIQFICTTHFPQLIGQAGADQVMLLDTPGATHPPQSYGMDSNWILRHIQGAEDRDPEVARRLDGVFEDIEESRFERAQKTLDELRSSIGEHPELVEAQALIGRYVRFDAQVEE